MSLPLLANTATANSTSSGSSKEGTRETPSSNAAPSSPVVEVKKQSNKKSEIAVTPDLSKTVHAPTLVAKKESPSSTPARTAASSQERPDTQKSLLVTKDSTPVRTEATPSHAIASGRLARVTAYWAGEGDYYTGRCISATGVRLHDGHCAVDPNIIPYGSVVEIAGVGKFLAVDTGSAVISRTAAREDGHTSAERNAIVVDVFFKDRSEGEKFAACAAKYVSISWWTPGSKGTEAKAARSLFADEDWNKIEDKQL